MAIVNLPCWARTLDFDSAVWEELETNAGDDECGPRCPIYVGRGVLEDFLSTYRLGIREASIGLVNAWTPAILATHLKDSTDIEKLRLKPLNIFIVYLPESS